MADWKALDQEAPEIRLTDEEARQVNEMLAEEPDQWFFTAEEFAARLATLRV